METFSPTARAYQLFQIVAVNGEQVFAANVTGDTNDIRAYGATHNQRESTAMILFNLNESYSLPVTLTLSNQSQSQDVKVTTDDKSLYNQMRLFHQLHRYGPALPLLIWGRSPWLRCTSRSRHGA
jgi:hypothetical protein